MATGVTRLSDVIVPAIFSPYTQELTTQKSRLIRSGAVVLDPAFSAKISGAGLTYSEPFYRDLDDDAENISTDDPSQKSTPNKIGTSQEIQVKLNRNQSWSSMDLIAALTGSDPMNAIANRVSDYWVRRMQSAFVATVKGVFAMDAAAPTGSSTHVKGDMIHDVSGTAFQDGATNFTAAGVIDTTVTMGDSMGDLSMVMMHSIVYARALKNNLIQFVPQSSNDLAVTIPKFLGRDVIVDDAMPNAGGVFDTWFFGAGAFIWGNGTPKEPTEVERVASAGNGSGQDILHNRVEWAIHPVGHAYVGSPPPGGPSNDSSTNNLAAATSWERRAASRKSIKIAKLITREF